MVRHRRKNRLLPSIQRRLLEQFAAGVSARTSAALVGINRNTAILCFPKLREIIAPQMATEAPFLAGEMRWMRTTSAASERAKKEEVQVERCRFLVCSSTMAGFTRWWLRMLSHRHYLVLLEIAFNPTALFIQTVFNLTMFWMCQNSTIFVSIISKFAEEKNHINGIENFWKQAKRHMRRYSRTPKAHFYLSLKKCEWRFNLRPVSNILKSISE